MNELVSIIMPSFNTEELIAESVKSVLAQTYQNWELLIVDDCSSDNTREVITSFDDNRIRFIENSRNVGAALSRNIALKEAKGKWVAFLDSDDLWTPEKLRKQIDYMESKGYHFSYTKYQEIDVEGMSTGITVSGPRHITKNGMFNYCWPGCLTVMYDRGYVGEIQIADIKKNNDYAIWLKVCRKADCFLVDEVLAKYRRGRKGSVSNHSIFTMVGWHYRLFHEAEGQNAVLAAFNTCRNLVFGFYKKIKYVKKVKKWREQRFYIN